VSLKLTATAPFDFAVQYVPVHIDAGECHTRTRAHAHVHICDSVLNGHLDVCAVCESVCT